MVVVTSLEEDRIGLRIEKKILFPMTLPFRIERKWFYAALIILSSIVLFLIFVLSALLGPGLSDRQRQWKEFRGDDPKGYPLEVVIHGYRMIQAYGSEPKAAQGSKPRAANLVEWEWKVAVKNKSGRDESVYVNYFLVDKDHLLVDVDYLISPQSVPAWETVMIQHKTHMIHEDLSRVATGVWEITRPDDKPSSEKRRKGF